MAEDGPRRAFPGFWWMADLVDLLHALRRATADHAAVRYYTKPAGCCERHRSGVAELARHAAVSESGRVHARADLDDHQRDASARHGESRSVPRSRAMAGRHLS